MVVWKFGTIGGWLEWKAEEIFKLGIVCPGLPHRRERCLSLKLSSAFPRGGGDLGSEDRYK